MLRLPGCSVRCKVGGVGVGEDARKHRLHVWLGVSGQTLEHGGFLQACGPDHEHEDPRTEHHKVSSARDASAEDLAQLLRMLSPQTTQGVAVAAPAAHFEASSVPLDTDVLKMKKFPHVVIVKLLCSGAAASAARGDADSVLSEFSSAECVATWMCPVADFCASRAQTFRHAGQEAEASCGVELEIKTDGLSVTPEQARLLEKLRATHWDVDAMEDVLIEAAKRREETVHRSFEKIGGEQSKEKSKAVYFRLPAQSFAHIGAKLDLAQTSFLSYAAGSCHDYSVLCTRALQFALARHLHGRGLKLNAQSLKTLLDEADGSEEVRAALASAFCSEVATTVASENVYRPDQALVGVSIVNGAGRTKTGPGEAQNFCGRPSYASKQLMIEEHERLRDTGKLSCGRALTAIDAAESERLHKVGMFGDCEDSAYQLRIAVNNFGNMSGNDLKHYTMAALKRHHDNDEAENALICALALRVQQGYHESQTDVASALGFAAAVAIDKKGNVQQSTLKADTPAFDVFADAVNGMKTGLQGHAFNVKLREAARVGLEPECSLVVFDAQPDVFETTAVTHMADISDDLVTVTTCASGKMKKLNGKKLPLAMALNCRNEVTAAELHARSKQLVLSSHVGNQKSKSAFWRFLIGAGGFNGKYVHCATLTVAPGQVPLRNIMHVEWPDAHHKHAAAQDLCAHAAEQLAMCACACVVGKDKALVACCRCPDCGKCELPHHAAAISALLDAADADIHNIGAEFAAVHDLATACGVCGAATGFQTGASLETDYLIVQDGQMFDYDEQTEQLRPVAYGPNQPYTEEAFMKRDPWDQHNMIRHFQRLPEEWPQSAIPLVSQLRQNPHAMAGGPFARGPQPGIVGGIPQPAMRAGQPMAQPRAGQVMPQPAMRAGQPMAQSRAGRVMPQPEAAQPPPGMKMLGGQSVEEWRDRNRKSAQDPAWQRFLQSHDVNGSRQRSNQPKVVQTTLRQYDQPRDGDFESLNYTPSLQPPPPPSTAITTSPSQTLVNNVQQAASVPTDDALYFSQRGGKIFGVLHRDGETLNWVYPPPIKLTDVPLNTLVPLNKNPGENNPVAWMKSTENGMMFYPTDPRLNNSQLGTKLTLVPLPPKDSSVTNQLPKDGQFSKFTQNYPLPTYPAPKVAPVAPVVAPQGSNGVPGEKIVFRPRGQGVPGEKIVFRPRGQGVPGENIVFQPRDQGVPASQPRGQGVGITQNPQSMRTFLRSTKCPITMLSIAAAAHAAADGADSAEEEKHEKLQMAPMASLTSGSMLVGLDVSVQADSEEGLVLAALGRVAAGYVCSSELLDGLRQDTVCRFKDHFPQSAPGKADGAPPVLLYTPRSQQLAAMKTAADVFHAVVTWDQEKAAQDAFAKTNGLQVSMRRTWSMCEYTL